MTGDKEFALLVGRAFLREVERGNKESAVAFGRAFLLSIGAKGPTENVKSPMAKGNGYDDLVVAEN